MRAIKAKLGYIGVQIKQQEREVLCGKLFADDTALIGES